MMLHQILTGQAKSVLLLALGTMAYLYVLPSVVAFIRGNRHFAFILVLNLLLSPVQGTILHFTVPDMIAVTPDDMTGAILVALLVNFGPGWLLLMAWAFKPGEPDARLLRARQSKLYDALTALPLMLWFAYSAWQLRPILVADAGMIAGGTATLFAWVQFFSLSAAALFDLLLIYLLVVRERPVAKSKGVLPRVFGFVGTFMGVGILQLPVQPLSLSLQILAAALVGIGSLGSLLVLWRLGKSFSIMPEARRLVTGGPYAYARHPLYSVEIVTVVGMALQFRAPWSWMVAALVVVLLVIRSHYEEGVLQAAYPGYAEYRLRVKRFIPGLI